MDHGNPPVLFPETLACLNALAKFPKALVSAGERIAELSGLLEQLGIHDHFSHVLHLKGTSFRKEDGSAFREIAMRFGVPPDTLVIVGDIPAVDIVGAHRCGALAIRIRQGKYAALEPQGTEAQADRAITSLNELPQALAALPKPLNTPKRLSG